MRSYAHYAQLANLFKYPMEGYHKRVNDLWGFLKENYPEAAKELTPFIEKVNSKTLFEVEEIFNKTFHIQAICFLDLGYVMFGEDYKRGDFLVHMKNEQAKVHHDCGEELPDNLPNALILMSLTEDQVFLEELAVMIMIPAFDKMLEEFKASRIEIRRRMMKRKHKAIIQENLDGANIFQYALKAIKNVVSEDFKHVDYTPIEPSIPPIDQFMNRSNEADSDCSSCSTINSPLVKKSQS